ncbi:MAG: phage tail protein [Polyangiales bacterium]
MTAFELPTISIDAVAAVVATTRPLLVNRDPSPAETDIALSSSVALELVDPGAAGIARAATRVWINGAVAFDGATTPPFAPAFAGPRASTTATADALRVVVDPLMPFDSLSDVVVRVVTATNDNAALDETYAFAIEDRTAPRLLAGVATSARTLRLSFDKPVATPSLTSLSVTPASAPAVHVAIVDTLSADTAVDIAVDREMTPDALYDVRALGVVDLHGNVVQPPFDVARVVGFRPARPATRRFDLWSMMPKYNRRSDTTGDLQRFMACLQELVDLQLADIDRFSDLLDLERAPESFLDLILRDLGNPFAFELDVLDKRRLAASLVEMYGQKGTGVGIRNVLRFFLNVDVVSISPLTATTLVLGESELGVDWELGPSDRFARYAFDVEVARVLADTERRQLRTLVDVIRPAHTHFVNLIEPLPPIVPDHWEIAVSELGLTTLLH